MMKRVVVFGVMLFIYACVDDKPIQGTIVEKTVEEMPVVRTVIEKDLSDTAFISKLAQLGYFDYVEKGKLKLVKDSLKKHFNTDKQFFTEYNREPPFQFYDARFYSCGDGEELYEGGGVVDLLEEMKPFLTRVGVPVNYSNDSYVGGGHTIVLNGTPYLLAKGGSALMWGETIQLFAEMVNAELTKHGAKERIYLMNYESEYMVFMTKEQYDLVCAYFPFGKRPLTVDDWSAETLKQIRKALGG